MRLIGLGWPGVFGAMVVPVTAAVLLYFVKWQNRRELVGYVAMWRRVAERMTRSRGLRRVETFVALALQLALIALVGLALGQPRLALQTREARSFVFVLDNSASMRALEGRRERFQIARAKLLRRIADLADLDQVALVTTSPPEVVAPLSRSRAPLLRELGRLSASDGPGRLGEAVERARIMLDARRADERDAVVAIHVLTDGSETIGEEAGEVPLSVEVEGEAVQNVGLTVLGARPEPENPAAARVLVEVGNFGTKHAKGEVRLALDDKLVEVLPFDLAGGARMSKLVNDVALGEQGRLVARLANVVIDGASDALPADDVAYALLPRRGELTVRVVDSADRFLMEALQANPRYKLERVPAAALEHGGEGLVVTDAPLPSELPPGGYVVFAPQGGDLPYRKTGELGRATFTDWRDDHPVLHGVALANVSVATSARVELGSGASALARWLDEPLVWAVDDGRRRAVVAGFHPSDSSLPLRASFPILLYNSLEWVAGKRAVTGRLPLGRAVRLATTATVVRGPSGPIRVERDGETVVFSAYRAGFYEAGTSTWAASVLDPNESRIAAGRVQPRTASVAAPRLRDHEVWPLLIALALSVLCLEWITYHRRWTS